MFWVRGGGGGGGGGGIKIGTVFEIILRIIIKIINYIAM